MFFSQVEDIAKAQDDWLDSEFAKEEAKKETARPAHVILFQHIPWFLKSVDEDDNYFNISHTKGRKEMLDKLYEKVRGARKSVLNYLISLQLSFQLIFRAA